MNPSHGTSAPPVISPPEGSALPESLVAAYLSTAYRVLPAVGMEGFTLQVGVAQPRLVELMQRHQSVSAAFITAWNPYGKLLPAAENRERNERLRTVLMQRGLAHWPGFGEDTQGSWSGEQSFLVLGLELATVRHLVTAFEQNAFIWAENDGAARLIFLR